MSSIRRGQKGMKRGIGAFGVGLVSKRPSGQRISARVSQEASYIVVGLRFEADGDTIR